MCKPCSSSSNLVLARNALNQEGLIGQFCSLCERIRDQQLDDKEVGYICTKLNTQAVYLVTLARDWVASYLASIERQEPPDHAISQLAIYVEDNQTEAIEMYEVEDQLRAHALLRLED